jgi:hypothetical protein
VGDPQCRIEEYRKLPEILGEIWKVSVVRVVPPKCDTLRSYWPSGCGWAEGMSIRPDTP